MKRITPAITASICGDEVVSEGSCVELDLARKVDARAAQSSIRLMRGSEVQRMQVVLGKSGRRVTIQLEAGQIGSFELIVTELADVRGATLVEDYRLRFTVLPLVGRVAREQRVEHAVHLRIGALAVSRLDSTARLDEECVELLKVVHRRTGAASEIGFDHTGQRIDVAARLAQVDGRREAKYGRIHETLFSRMEKASSGKKLPIVIWPRLDLPAAPYEKPAQVRSIEPPEGERRLAKTLRKATSELVAVLGRRGLAGAARKSRNDESLPCVSTTATVEQIRSLAGHRAVGGIYFDDRSAVTDLANSIAIARSDRVHTAGFDGTGIRVAVFENGPKTTTNLVFAGRFTTTPSSSTDENNHARLTCAIVKNTESGLPHGHAPDCDLYSANSSNNDALRWAVRDQHCTVVSQSFHRSTEPGGSDLQSDDLLKDWLALRWPYPTIVQAAGNFWLGDADGISPPRDEFVNHKGYNCLAIGNHDDTATSMSGDSVFRNPTTTHGDRELPELAANGTVVSANGQSMSGTSFAAPATAGVVALLQDADGVLCSWPEGCRAILLASAGRNVRDSTWWQDVVNRVDGWDGSGAVDARAGLTITQQRRWRDAPATRHGWDIGTLSSSVIGSDRLATFRYRIAVPQRLFLPRVKVALAWDSAVTSFLGLVPLSSKLTVDLDLEVRDSRGNVVASSASWDNSYEIAEFVPRAGEEYEIVIRRWSGQDSVWYGIAWTVTGTWIDIFTDVPVVLAEP